MPSDKLHCLNSFQVVSIKRERERAQLLMAQTGWLRGHIADIPEKGLIPSNQNSTDKPFITLNCFQSR